MSTGNGSVSLRAGLVAFALALATCTPCFGACELIVSDWSLAFGKLWAGSSQAAFARASAPSVYIKGAGNCKNAGDVTLRILPTQNQARCGRPCLRSANDARVDYELGFGSDMKQVVTMASTASLSEAPPIVTARIPAGALRQAGPATYSDTVFIEITP